jgi:hypothetical protein
VLGVAGHAVGKKYNKKVSANGRLFLLYNEAIWFDDTESYEVSIDVE